MAISPFNKNTIQQYFPYTPDYTTWEDFNGNIAIHYGQEPVMFATEDNWREAADNISRMSVFAAYPAPSSDGYETWQDWAREFVLIINGPSQ